MIKKSTILLLFFFLNIELWAQDQPLYNQTYFNPYLYNPSYVGQNDITEVFLTYRKQWASIADAPRISAFNLQHATRGNIALGLLIQSETNTGLTTNSAHATFGYKVPFAKDHNLKFGLSAGVLHNFLDIEELTNSNASLMDDPALMNSLDNTYYFSSQFGVHYRYKKFRIGASFPELFNNDANSDDDFNSPEFEELEQRIFDASYLFELSPLFSIRPYLIYRDINNQQNQVEASAIAYYKELLWIGGGYRLDYGAAGHIGFVIKNIFEVAYSYEFGGISGNSFSDGSHEFNLNIKLGKKRNEKTKKQAIPQSTTFVEKEEPDPEPKEEVIEEEIQDESNEPIIEENDVVEEKVVEENAEEYTTDDYNQVVFENVSETSGFMTEGNYVIVGAFLNKENAERYNQSLKEAGYLGKIGRTTNKAYNYVYLDNFENLSQAISYKNKLRSLNEFQFKDAWVLVLE